MQEKAYEKLAESADLYEQEIQDWWDKQEAKSRTVIVDQKVNWFVQDSKGNQYHWSIPVSSYESHVIADRNYEYFYFEGSSGKPFNVIDHTKYVGTSFRNVIDELYDNSSSDTDFVYEVWYIVSKLTTYSFDIGEYPRYAIETLSRGGGDCEDTAILIVEMLKSSSHTKDWKFEFLYFNSDNLVNPDEIDHVVPVINTGEKTFIIESTAKTDEGMNMWNGKSIFGWYKEV